MNGKNIAIISYITIIGWVAAFVINMNERDGFASFHIRQTLGIWLSAAVAGFFSFIPPIGFLLWIITIVFWLIGFFAAINGRMANVPILGDYFQKWFKGL